LIIQSESSNSFFLPLTAALGAAFETEATKSSSSPAKRLLVFWGWGLGYCFWTGTGTGFMDAGFDVIKGASSSLNRALFVFFVTWGLDVLGEGKSAPSSSSNRLFFLEGEVVGAIIFGFTISTYPSSSSNKPFFFGCWAGFGAYTIWIGCDLGGGWETGSDFFTITTG